MNEISKSSTVSHSSKELLLPKLGVTNIGEPVTYHSLYIIDTLQTTPPGDKESLGGDVIEGFAGAVDPFAIDPQTKNQELAYGALVSNTQTWEQKGLALGNLLKSICLAPGEVTRVAIQDWQRRTAGRVSDQVTAAEEVASDIDQTRSVNEVQRGVATEAQRGTATNYGASTTAQAGYSSGSVLGGGSASLGSTQTFGLSASFSAGIRGLAAETKNNLDQRTQERSQSLRSRRASVVKEVTETEAETQSTRILANYNRRHALNIEYFEVLQTYALKTELADWHRCIFVPLEQIDFSDPKNIETHKAKLYQIFSDLNRQDLIDLLLGGGTENSNELNKALAQLRAENDAIAVERRKAKSVLGGFHLYFRGGKDGCSALASEGHYEKFMRDLCDILDIENPSLGVEIRKYAELDLQDLKKGPREQSLEIWMGMVKCFSKNHGALEYALERRFRMLSNKRANRQEQLESRRKELLGAALALPQRLADNNLIWNQQVWMRMDPFRVYQMLRKIKVGSRTMSSVVDPHPVGFFGNYVAFRWGFSKDGDASDTNVWEMDRKTFKEKYVEPNREEAGNDKNLPMVAVPSDGVFAEAVLGQGEAAEEIDNTKFWEWEKHNIPILPADIKPLEWRDRSKGMELTTGQLASSLAALRSQTPADISHIAQAVTALQNGDMFRNMSGLAELITQSAALAAESSGGAKHAAEQAQQIHAKMVDMYEHVFEEGVKLITSDAGKALIAEAIVPGSGVATSLLQMATGKK